MYRVGRDAEVEAGPEGGSLLSLIGPRSRQLAGDVALGPEHAHREVGIGGARCRVVATDLGVDLIVPAGAADAVREHLLDAGAEPVEEPAAEIARVESGRPRLGREIVAGTMPQEAGINERAVSFTKGCYIGQETVARLHYKGKPNRHLRLLRPDREVAGRATRSRLGERELGTVGTAVLSPARGPLALAILRREAEPGAEVVVGDGVPRARRGDPPEAEAAERAAARPGDRPRRPAARRRLAAARRRGRGGRRATLPIPEARTGETPTTRAPTSSRPRPPSSLEPPERAPPIERAAGAPARGRARSGTSTTGGARSG